MSLADRFKDAIALIVEELLPNRRYYAPVEYQITKASGDGLFSAKPASSSGFPPITDAPIRGIAGGNAKSKLDVGTSVLVGFIEGDPGRPFLLNVLEVPQELALAAAGLDPVEHVTTAEAMAVFGQNLIGAIGALFTTAGAAPTATAATIGALLVAPGVGQTAVLLALAAAGIPPVPPFTNTSAAFDATIAALGAAKTGAGPGVGSKGVKTA